jgi:hypothetical protein
LDNNLDNGQTGPIAFIKAHLELKDKLTSSDSDSFYSDSGVIEIALDDAKSNIIFNKQQIHSYIQKLETLSALHHNRSNNVVGNVVFEESDFGFPFIWQYLDNKEFSYVHLLVEDESTQRCEVKRVITNGAIKKEPFCLLDLIKTAKYNILYASHKWKVLTCDTTVDRVSQFSDRTDSIFQKLRIMHETIRQKDISRYDDIQFMSQIFLSYSKDKNLGKQHFHI